MKPPCGACVDYDGAACDWCKRNDYRAFRGIETLATSAPVLTNYDRLISKTPEELAEWLDNIDTAYEPGTVVSMHGWLSWLKSPVEDAT